ncbi:hypothetical protein GOP47_0023956 [Adiantum capillus-veneris]|uniref:Uncharacterized protein n=1 Tax=Adiantum capillus-veneris TaxID=13818 RepID=A0A9D4Z6F4_ADICA|nr:hypothetical protein GOP47_0023956 [Adiantum capillus-veneris]
MFRTLQQQAPAWSPSSPLFLPSSSSSGNGKKNSSGIYRFLLRPSFFTSSHEAMEALTRASLPSPSVKSFGKPITVRASLTEFPVLWVVRTCVFYALLQVGIAGPPPSSSLQGLSDRDELQALNWLKNIFGGNEEAQRAKELKKGRTKWQTTTKGTLKRRYRVPSKSEGRRLLNQISSLLSDDDTFRDATSHKGCQIRRENAHAETVCCHNVRAMFDELPTPHLVIEITAFPSGPITAADYHRADKIEKLLRAGNSI